ncbi:MAG: pyruvate kinase [Oscillospiraceae bacterium]|nr:pyruvate kinase [Oscillospiraceae bacterium]
MNKTKIVCTLGPATEDDAVLRELMKSGMNVARQNFSHGDHENHAKIFKQVKRIREELGLPVASLLDTVGPEVRVKTFKNGNVTLVDKQNFILSTIECEGDTERVSITYADLPKDIEIGTSVLVDDGLIELKVMDFVPCECAKTGKKGTDIITRVIHGGVLKNSKSCNFPGKKLSMPYISNRDKEDIIFGAKLGFDFIAASFVRCDEDVLEVRKILEENGGGAVRVIAKIENQEGVDNIDDIIRVADGIMVARGDMGVEIPFEELPRIQKMLIRRAYLAGMPVITATQMLESMVKNPRPTRAETTDVANAIYDGTSAIMLSGETAAGAFPIEAVRTMVKIAECTEANINYAERFRSWAFDKGMNVTNAIAHATVTTALDLEAKAILTVTHGGNTARLLSKFRPHQPVLGCTPSEMSWRQMSMSWGVRPIMAEEEDNTDDLLQHAVERAVEEGYLENGDLVVITAGVPVGFSGTTNLMKVHTVGDILVSGTGITEKIVTAPLCVVLTVEDALRDFAKGDILVAPKTDNSLMRILRSASGIIVEEDGADSHAAIVGLTLDIPVIVGAKNATKILKSGVAATLDARKGMVLN